MNESSYKQIYADILEIISKKSCEPINKLSLETAGNNDLGVYGDDWDELIEPILKKYPITDWSAFVFFDHMAGEGYPPRLLINIPVFIPQLIIAAVVFLFSKQKSKAIFQYRPFKEIQYKDDPLYIADIFNSAIKGKWEYAKDSEQDLYALI